MTVPVGHYFCFPPEMKETYHIGLCKRLKQQSFLPAYLTNAQMLVATDSCEIYEVLDSDGTSLHKGPLLQGHFGNGVRGLAAHPDNPDLFATAGTDRTVRIWSRKERRMVRIAYSGWRVCASLIAWWFCVERRVRPPSKSHVSRVRTVPQNDL